MPINHHDWRADAKHFTRGRGRYKVPRLIIVHSSVGHDSRAWLTTTSPPDHVGSAHALARGSDRYNLVDLLDTAYAAGYCLPGISNSNTLNLEIENASDGDHIIQPYDPDTLNNAAQCVAAWSFSFAIPLLNVRRHADVAVYGPDYEFVAMRGKLGRKQDPIGLDWAAFLRRVQAWELFFQSLPPAEHSKYIV